MRLGVTLSVYYGYGVCVCVVGGSICQTTGCNRVSFICGHFTYRQDKISPDNDMLVILLSYIQHLQLFFFLFFFFLDETDPIQKRVDLMEFGNQKEKGG